MKTKFSLFVIICIVTCTISGKASGKTILDVISQHKQMSMFKKALGASGLSKVLRDPGPFTVLVPTDTAFKSVDSAALDALMRNKDDLAKVIAYHMIRGTFPLAELKKLTTTLMPTMQGAQLSLRTEKRGLAADHAKITTADIKADNGVIHMIDAVLQPQPKM